MNKRATSFCWDGRGPGLSDRDAALTGAQDAATDQPMSYEQMLQLINPPSPGAGVAPPSEIERSALADISPVPAGWLAAQQTQGLGGQFPEAERPGVAGARDAETEQEEPPEWSPAQQMAGVQQGKFTPSRIADCCACAANGHAAAPPSSVMN